MQWETANYQNGNPEIVLQKKGLHSDSGYKHPKPVCNEISRELYLSSRQVFVQHR
jgi:hypothetical protein